MLLIFFFLDSLKNIKALLIAFFSFFSWPFNRFEQNRFLIIIYCCNLSYILDAAIKNSLLSDLFHWIFQKINLFFLFGQRNIILSCIIQEIEKISCWGFCFFVLSLRSILRIQFDCCWSIVLQIVIAKSFAFLVPFRFNNDLILNLNLTGFVGVVIVVRKYARSSLILCFQMTWWSICYVFQFCFKLGIMFSFIVQLNFIVLKDIILIEIKLSFVENWFVYQCENHLVLEFI